MVPALVPRTDSFGEVKKFLEIATGMPWKKLPLKAYRLPDGEQMKLDNINLCLLIEPELFVANSNSEYIADLKNYCNRRMDILGYREAYLVLSDAQCIMCYQPQTKRKYAAAFPSTRKEKVICEHNIIPFAVFVKAGFWDNLHQYFKNLLHRKPSSP